MDDVQVKVMPEQFILVFQVNKCALYARQMPKETIWVVDAKAMESTAI